MCGIIGYVGPQGTDVTSILLEGLSKLEYRGYDSAGIAVLTSTGQLEVRRRAGKIANLIESVENGSRPHAGSLGIGHTRWATHGRPNDTNAHPHPDCTGVLTVVHNGIIENYAELRSELEREGHTFRSETDTEVLSNLVERYYFGEQVTRTSTRPPHPHHTAPCPYTQGEGEHGSLFRPATNCVLPPVSRSAMHGSLFRPATNCVLPPVSRSAMHDLEQSVRLALQCVTGAYAIAVVSSEQP